MYERMLNKNESPTEEEFLAHIGKSCDLFIVMNNFLKDGLANEINMYFDVHDKGWAIGYHYKYKSKKTYLCNIVAEKDAFLFVTNLRTENIEKLHESGTPYIKKV